MYIGAILSLLVGLVLAPLLPGIINRVKAKFGGRRGQPILQMYFDLWKLLHKGAVYSRTTTWVFQAAPIVGLAAVVSAMLIVPFVCMNALVGFPGDLVLMAGLLGLGRFFTMIAALDTGSSFEGMGASREAHFSALGEPVLLLALAVLGRKTVSFSLSEIFGALTPWHWVQSFVPLALVVTVLLVVLLLENSRIPVDDPNTHLELTMIHEVMVLDHGGPDFAFIVYGSALRLWLMGVLLVNVLLPVHSGYLWIDLGVGVIGMLGVAVVVGIVESIMARLRLLFVPQLLVGAGVMAAVALVVMQ
jgi:formate hydrogenlyase subunit 4